MRCIFRFIIAAATVGFACSNTIAIAAAHDCINACLQQFSSQVDVKAFGEGKKLLDMDWLDIVEMSNEVSDPEVMEERYVQLCKSYDDMNYCLSKCPNHVLEKMVKSGFLAMQVFCQEEKQNLVKYVPCLAKHEAILRENCKKELNQTIVAAQVLQQTVITEKDHKLKSALRSVCRNTTELIKCMEPSTVEVCKSEAPIQMMRQMVALSFQNFQNLYIHLGLNEQLPPACRTLIDIDQNNKRSPKFDTQALLNEIPDPYDQENAAKKQEAATFGLGAVVMFLLVRAL